MVTRTRLVPVVMCAVLVALCALPASAQLESSLSAYTGPNATGYLRPLNDAFGATLNNGFYYSARIPKAGFRISLEFPVMGVIFEDEDKTFSATTEEGFMPTTPGSVDAPTVVGSGSAVQVPGQGGTSFAHPGGFSLNSFGIIVPQLRVGAVAGTEAVLRLLPGIETGDSELGKISLFGIGARHSISQWFSVPFDIAGGFLWQQFKVGENSAGNDLISTNAFSVSVHGSKAFGLGFAYFEPYTGLALDTYKTDLEYEGSDGSTVDVKFDNESQVRWTIGAGFNLIVAHIYGQYDLASTSSFSFGLALGNLGI